MIEEDMFEQPVGKAEKDRSRLIMILSAIAVVAVIGLIILVTSLGNGSDEMQMVRAGSPEFDSYSQFIKVTKVDMREGERLGARYGRIIATAENTGDKVITGLQLRGAALGFNNEVLKERIISPIPRQQETLGPRQSIQFDLYLEPIPDLSQVMDMTVELYGLKVQ